MAMQADDRVLSAKQSRPGKTFVDAFFQGFTGSGFFGPLRQPGSPSQIFADTDDTARTQADSQPRPGRGLTHRPGFGLQAKVFREAEPAQPGVRTTGFHRRRSLRSQA